MSRSKHVKLPASLLTIFLFVIALFSINSIIFFDNYQLAYGANMTGVQTGTLDFTSAVSETKNSTLSTSVDATKSVLIFNANNNINHPIHSVSCYIYNSTTVSCTQNKNTAEDITVRWYVLQTPSGEGDNGPRYQIVDIKPPQIVSDIYEPSEPIEGREIIVTANIVDDVGVEKADLLYMIPEHNREFHEVEMQRYNSEYSSDSNYFIGSIPASDVRIVGLQYWILAQDFAGNNIQSSLEYVDVEKRSSVTEVVTKEKPLPDHVLEAINSMQEPTPPVGMLEVISMGGGNVIQSYQDKIMLKNNGNLTLHGIRLMLSPEISKEFYLDANSIGKIEPNSNVTVTVKMFGNPNRDVYGKIMAIDGSIMIMVTNLNPVILPVKINSLESYHYQSFMEKVADMEKHRSRIPLISTILNGGHLEKSDVQVTTRSGAREITSPSDQLIIKNTGDRTLNNVRIITSDLGNMFLMDKYNIAKIEPNGEISVQMISMMDTSKYATRDYKGEIIIAPDNSLPKSIPVHIEATPRHDSMDDFEIRIASGKNEITTAVDRIQIKNLGNRTMDSVKIMLSEGLTRIYSLDNVSFRNIQPNEEVTVGINYNSGGLKTLMQDFTGELTIVSEHHNLRRMPIKIEWNKIEGEHFTIYARSGDESVAKNVMDELEQNYQNVTSSIGEMKSKGVIYIASTIDEMKLINPSGHPYYSYTDDAIFVCACDDIGNLSQN